MSERILRLPEVKLRAGPLDHLRLDGARRLSAAPQAWGARRGLARKRHPGLARRPAAAQRGLNDARRQKPRRAGGRSRGL